MKLKELKREVFIVIFGLIYLLVMYYLSIFTNFNYYRYLFLDKLIQRSHYPHSLNSYIQNQYELESLLIIFLIPFVCFLISFFLVYKKLYTKYGKNIFTLSLNFVKDLLNILSLIFFCIFILGSSELLFGIGKDYDIGYFHFFVFSISSILLSVLLSLIIFIIKKFTGKKR